MKACVAMLAMALFLMCGTAAQAGVDAKSYAGWLPRHVYQFAGSFEVDGSQGIATDGEFYYVSGCGSLAKYDRTGRLVLKNDRPFTGYTVPANQIGDIDVHGGELYVSAQQFEDGAAQNIQIAVYDASTLKFKRTFRFKPASGQEEVSGITVDHERGSMWMCSWESEESGRYLYEYSLKNGRYLRKVRVFPVPQWVQGVFASKGSLYLTADECVDDEEQFDHLYRVDITKKSYAAVVLEHSFGREALEGEIEGLCMDVKAGEMLVLFKRSPRGIQGASESSRAGEERAFVCRYRMSPLR